MWQGAMGEPTHVDDIEYLCGKALANDYGLSLMGINPDTAETIPALPRLAGVVRKYEHLRRAHSLPEEVKARLRTPGAEFTLTESANRQWEFRPVKYDRHKVQAVGDRSSRWRVINPFGPQPLQLRIEALMAAGPYDAPESILLADFEDASQFADRATAPGISVTLATSTDHVRTGTTSGRLSATNTTSSRTGSWCRLGKTFGPPINLAGHGALGVWVHGDGRGQLLNLQQTSPSHLTRAIADHYIDINFIGWRYFELIEPEGARHADYEWPYGDIYSIYRESIRLDQVETLSLWLNHIEPRETATCYLGPIRALPLVPTKLRNPAVTVGGRTLTFPVEIETGQYLEFRAEGHGTLYGAQGEVLGQVTPAGDVPQLVPGDNEVSFTCETDGKVRSRAQVSVMTQGPPFGSKKRTAESSSDAAASPSNKQ
jgi:hypothetical protein